MNIKTNFLLTALVCVLGARAEEYIVYRETWQSGGMRGWSAPEGLLTLTAPSGALQGQFARQVFAFPDSDAFTANSGASLGKFAQAYLAPGQRAPLWLGFDFLAAEVQPSSCLLRLTGGVGQTNTFFRSVLTEVAATGHWASIDVPLDSVTGWSGGSFAAFSNMLQNVTAVEVRLTRNGTELQNYLLDNFTLLLRIGSLTDSDGDGLPDVYEQAHTGSATAMIPGDDIDGDSQSNRDEYDGVSDPRDIGDRILLKISRFLRSTGAAEMDVNSYLGRYYRIERNTNLLATVPDWQPVGAAPTPGNGGSLTLTDAAPPAGPCFYRIKLSRE